jgi:hypothetical protein
MKKLTLSICLMLIAATGFAQAPDWAWAKSAGGTENDYANSIAVDASGNEYVAGDFYSSTITFGSTILTNADNTSNTDDVFLAKYDASGNVLWAKSAGGTGYDGAYSVVVDAIGNIYIAGYYRSSTITFGSTTLTNAGSYDVFLAKYNSNGNVLWAKSAGGTGSDYAYSIAVDTLGNTYLTGSFQSPTLTFGSTTLINAGYYDLFLTKYDINGNVLWAKGSGGTSNDIAWSVAVDASGNSIMAGSFYSANLTFGSTTLTNAGLTDIFLTKYDANGNVIWAKSAGGTKDDYAYSVAIDATGNTYLAGVFVSSTINFGTTTLTNIGSDDVFLAKYDVNGNVLWAKSAGGTSYDYAYSVAVDTSGNSYLAGYFESPAITFDTIILTNVGSDDIFLTKYDTSGNVLWAKSSGGTGNDKANSVVVDAFGSIYLGGYFGSPSINFYTTTLTNAGNADIFLAKINGDTIGGINELSDPLNISLFPNPSTDEITIIIPEKSIIEISNIEGQIIKIIKRAEKQTTINVSNLSGGVYIIKAKTEKGVAVKKFIKE